MQVQLSPSTAFLQRASFHFATVDYASCFAPLPEPDPAYFRNQAVDYLRKEFNPQLWYDQPICSLVKGQRFTENAENDIRDTTNALGQVNGKQIWSSAEELQTVRQHICSYQSPVRDQRDLIRQVEEDIFTHHAGYLIGNQCVDFGKQDGVTEIEEAVMANTVERRLNDLLLHDEQAGILTVDRRPQYVACVSNFSNFLDLSRKTLRSLEVGIPVIILGRSHTSQHVFRWVELLLDLAVVKAGMDAGMITYLSCDVPDLAATLQACEPYTGNLYATCSRELAATLKATYPRTVASTGGPNTLVVTSNMSREKNQGNRDKNDKTAESLTAAVQAAIRTSATIESAGQCTALRHCVVPLDTSHETLAALWSKTTTPESPQQALKAGQFEGVFTHTATPLPPDDTYKHPANHPYVSYKISDTLPTGPVNEYWRQVAVDFTKMDLANSKDDRHALCHWLNTNQPISLAVNGPRDQVLDVGLELFDHTGLVVYTLGSTDSVDTMPAALTCQARPQDGECFGEFPPRNVMSNYSMYPVIVPSSNPSCGASYTAAYLKKQTVDPYWSKTTHKLIEAISDDLVRGYAVTLIRYLQAVDAANPHVGRTSQTRTAVWGLQRPPLGQSAHLYVQANANWNAVAPLFLLYYVTNARDQMILTLNPENTAVRELCDVNDIPYHVASQDEWQEQCNVQPEAVFLTKVVSGDGTAVDTLSFPMASLYALQHLPAGHVKSTAANDDEFLYRFKGLSKKWLKTLF